MEWDGIVFMMLWLLTGGGAATLAVVARKYRTALRDATDDLEYAARAREESRNECIRLGRCYDAERLEKAAAITDRDLARKNYADLQRQHEAATARDRKSIETLTSQRDRAMKIIDDQARVYADGIAAVKTQHRNDTVTYESRMRAVVAERDRLREELDAAHARLASIVNAVQGDATDDVEPCGTLLDERQ